MKVDRNLDTAVCYQTMSMCGGVFVDYAMGGSRVCKPTNRSSGELIV